MKRFCSLALILVLYSHTISLAQSIVHFRISKPLCLLTFLEAANKQWDASRTYSTYIYKHLAPEDRDRFARLVDQFAGLNMATYSSSTASPVGRQKPKSVYNAIKGIAVRSKYTEKFIQNISGNVPDEQLQTLRDVMLKAEPFYNDIIWNEYKNAAEQQLAELEKYSGRADVIFVKLKRFYGSTWPAHVPFEIGIYPIPGAHGHTTATPHGNSLVLAVLTGERDYAMRMGVAIHEMCHVLYDKQPFKTQWREDSVFAAKSSGYAKYAYSYFDEALATACGNGWAYENLSGHIDASDWYDDTYINGYAKAIYPMTREYINSGKKIDAAFIKNAISLFKRRFPDAISDYNNLLNRVSLYTDAATMDEFQWINKTLRKYYRITSCSSSFPIADNQTVGLIKKSPGTQLFIIHENHSEDLAILKEIFPELRTKRFERESLISFTDKKKRPIIILNVDGADRIANGLQKMVQQKNMGNGDMVSKID